MKTGIHLTGSASLNLDPSIREDDGVKETPTIGVIPVKTGIHLTGGANLTLDPHLRENNGIKGTASTACRPGGGRDPARKARDTLTGWILACARMTEFLAGSTSWCRPGGGRDPAMKAIQDLT